MVRRVCRDEGRRRERCRRELNLATDRSTAEVLVSDVKRRDIKTDAYTLSFHSRLPIEGAELH